MSDAIDKANDAAAVFLAESLAKQRAQLPAGPSLSQCEDCGGPIPEARRQAVPGCRLCVFCQTYEEIGFP